MDTPETQGTQDTEGRQTRQHRPHQKKTEVNLGHCEGEAVPVLYKNVLRYQRVIRGRISKKNRQNNGQKIPKGNQRPYIEEEQTKQWPKDTKG